MNLLAASAWLAEKITNLNLFVELQIDLDWVKFIANLTLS